MGHLQTILKNDWRSVFKNDEVKVARLIEFENKIKGLAKKLKYFAKYNFSLTFSPGLEIQNLYFGYEYIICIQIF